MQNKIHMVLGCDCDPDRADFFSNNSGVPTWRGVIEGIRLFREQREIFANKYDFWPRMTWFVRSDFQMQSQFGDAAFCIERFGSTWQALENEGDEIAWHPHFWNLNLETNQWFQELESDAFKVDCLNLGFNQFKAKYGEAPRTVHSGWCYQDNTTMKFLREHGVIADCSAIPEHFTLGFGTSDQADWRHAPSHIYNPSKIDYRLPETKKENQAVLLEVPASTGSSFFVNQIKGIKDTIKRGVNWHKRPVVKRQVPLMTLSPVLNKALLRSALDSIEQQNLEHFFSYTHCDEFTPSSNRSLSSRVYNLSNFFVNLEFTIQRLAAKGIETIPSTLSQLVDKRQ